jgi:hypothetical protein
MMGNINSSPTLMPKSKNPYVLVLIFWDVKNNATVEFIRLPTCLLIS